MELKIATFLLKAIQYLYTDKVFETMSRNQAKLDMTSKD